MRDGVGQVLYVHCPIASCYINMYNCKGFEVKVKVRYLLQCCLHESDSLEVAADWYELMILCRIMWPSIARAIKQLDLQCSTQTPRSLHPVARKLLLISLPVKCRRLS